ncbi:hypothetical protein GGR25_000414 [Kaistia hirudinis]|uniref:Alanine-rich protein SCI7.12c n=1 Tax=Kaistia hirudinis TaxID=1293440 RepID=A0A840ALF3_9HYPH|nr:hypothetical protein [Kaistia hirudinis]MBB3929395.1 hypothetical protein [Kaistia hirudinis]
MTSDGRYRALYAYAWDLAEEEPDAFVADMKRLSLDTLSIAASYHAGKFLRPHGRSGHVYFPEDGTVHCHVTPERYGRIRPAVSAVAADGDPFGVFAARDDIAVNAWTVLMHNSRLGQLHPEAVVRNAFGDPYLYSLCPAHPDARAYAVALSADIADRYPIRGLSLETPGWLPYQHGYHHEFALVGANPWLDFNLGLCFCDHCRAGATAAGIDAEGLRQRVGARVTAYLAASCDTPPAIGRAWLEADLVQDAELGAFLRWRCDVVTSLVAEIRAAVRPDAELFVIPSVQRPSAAAWYEGSDLVALAAAAYGIELCLYEPSVAAVIADFGEVRRRLGNEAKLRAILRPGPPDFADEGGFTAAIHGLSAAGLSDFAFYNYGHVRRSNLEWIGRAFASLD